jgi:hypothetical protein
MVKEGASPECCVPEFRTDQQTCPTVLAPTSEPSVGPFSSRTDGGPRGADGPEPIKRTRSPGALFCRSHPLARTLGPFLRAALRVSQPVSPAKSTPSPTLGGILASVWPGAHIRYSAHCRGETTRVHGQATSISAGPSLEET